MSGGSGGTTPGRTALVTGASSGIGEATVRRLLRDGWIVYAAARRVDRMRPLEEHGARVLHLDLNDPASIDAAVARIAAEAGGVDVLVNNAGYGEYGSVEEVPIEEARRQMDVLVFGPARLVQLVVPGMRAKRAGRIVNVSSIGGRISFPLGAWYHMGKFAVEALSDALRRELAPFGIRVVVVQPGAIRTEWAEVTYGRLDAASASGPYAGMAAASRRLGMEAIGAGGIAVRPEIVAETIARAVHAPRPRPRYAVPFHARFFLFLARVLGDRGIDALMRLQLRWPVLARRPFARGRGPGGGRAGD